MRSPHWVHRRSHSVNILIVTPAPPRSRFGNRVTALRWARLLRQLGHRVKLAERFDHQRCDLLVALHARHSHDSIRRCHDTDPNLPLIVALTGTDVYGAEGLGPEGRDSVKLAHRVVALQPLALRRIPARWRAKGRVILQSAVPLASRAARRPGQHFTVCVVGHLRDVKDPFRAALAVRDLPAGSALRVVHLGEAMTAEMDEQARREQETNPRYRWMGGQPRWRVRRWLARGHLMVLSSRMEGGANVISEALAARLPVVASRIPGTVGLLGDEYPGYFPPGNTAALRRLLLRAEHDPSYVATLTQWMERLAPRVTPEAERAAWEALLAELMVSP